MACPRSLLVTAALVAAAAVWIHGQPRTASDRLSPQDFQAIEELVQGYTKGIDIGPEDASWVFAPDASFVYGSQTVSGEKALKEFYANLRKQNTSRTIRHLLSNLVVKATPEGATGTVYLTTIEPPVAVTAVGMYEDTYVRTANGWRIKRRLYHQDLPGPLSQPR
jgi:hypothetical protein